MAFKIFNDIKVNESLASKIVEGSSNITADDIKIAKKLSDLFKEKFPELYKK